MLVNVGINGFGRIGRIIFRTCIQNNDIKVTAINDPAVDIDYICYLIKFDSTHGRFKNDLTFTASEITIDADKIKVFHEKLPSSIPWHTAGVQYVVEASGMFTNLEKASDHLASISVKRVIVTAPSVDIPMMILGVNEQKFSVEQKVISCASSTLYCLAPLIKVLEENYGVVEGFITSIHAMTPSLKPLDGLCLRGKHWRDHRSIHQNIIPAATGACKALGKIIPHVKDKMTGLAFRVPIVNVSVLDVTIRLFRNTTMEDIIKRIDYQSQTTMKNIVKTSSEEAVSSDFLNDVNSCILDVNSSLQLTSNFFKLICWYENEYSYACRVVDTIMHSEKCFRIHLISKFTDTYHFASKTLFLNPIIPLSDGHLLLKPYKINKKSKALLNIFQDNDYSVKLPSRLVTTKRICRNSELNNLVPEHRKNEVFRKWNDDSAEKLKMGDNIKPFCNSCIALKPTDISYSHFENQGRCKNVKEVLTKMVYMTENSDNKSNQKKYHDYWVDRNVDDKIDKNQELIKPKSVCQNIPLSGDYECYYATNFKNIFNTNNILEKNEKGVNEFKLIENEKKSENLNDKINTEKEFVFDIKLDSDNENKQKFMEKLNYNLDFNRTAEIYENNKLHKPTQNENYIQKLQPNNSKAHIINHVNADFIPKLTNSIPSLHDNDDKNAEILKQDGVDSKSHINNKIGHDISEKNQNQIKAQKTNGNDLKSDMENVNDQFSNTKSELKESIKRFSVESMLVGNDSRSISTVNTNTSISNGNRSKKDIYDQLDSASATDSENSFQIKERKSQIISLSDLTTSVDDIARLDKICRIIEISDELSDRLFSKLDNNDSEGLDKKIWSFKDLCERLKLDEFCNNVFGQPNIQNVKSP